MNERRQREDRTHSAEERRTRIRDRREDKREIKREIKRDDRDTFDRDRNRPTDNRRSVEGRCSIDRNQSINSRDTMRRRSARKKKQRNILIFFLVFLAFVVIVGGVIGAWLYQKYSLSDEEMSASKYYGISQSSELVVILDTEILGIEGMVINEVYYLSYDFVLDNLNSRFYWDDDNNNLLYTLEDGTVTASLGESYYEKGNDKTTVDYQIVKSEGNDIYVAAEYVEIYTDIDITMYDEPYRIVVTSEFGDMDVVTALKDTQVRYQAGVKSDILSYVAEGETLIYMESGEDEELEDWTKVSTMDGYIGYVQTKKIGEVQSTTLTSDFVEQEYTSISVDYTVNMVWHQVSSAAANDTVLSSIASTSGVTTIAPTWFFINSTDGEVTSLASETYVDYVHQLGMDVWAVLNDFDGAIGSYQETYDVLSSSEAREDIINTIIAEAIRTGIDGINVDIELVSSDAGVHYIQFIRELSVKCRLNGIVLSVANYSPQSFNMHYDYEEQGIVVDYVVIMGYDEHYGGSPVAGSVSSIGFVEEGIVNMLTMVSAEKIISGIPFYTRLWEETDKTEEEIAAAEAEAVEGEEVYLTNVSSSSYGMEAAQAKVDEAGATATWDETTMQYYATWMVEDVTYQIWLEDVESIEAKVQLIKEYNLAGVAAWKLGLEDDAVWSVIEKYVN